METLVADAREQLDDILRQSPLAPRSTADYQALLEPATGDDEESHEGEDHSPDDSAA